MARPGSIGARPPLHHDRPSGVHHHASGPERSRPTDGELHGADSKTRHAHGRRLHWTRAAGVVRCTRGAGCARNPGASGGRLSVPKRDRRAAGSRITSGASHDRPDLRVPRVVASRVDRRPRNRQDHVAAGRHRRRARGRRFSRRPMGRRGGLRRLQGRLQVRRPSPRRLRPRYEAARARHRPRHLPRSA